MAKNGAYAPFFIGYLLSIVKHNRAFNSLLDANVEKYQFRANSASSHNSFG
jgi:hypothetical protein